MTAKQPKFIKSESQLADLYFEGKVMADAKGVLTEAFFNKFDRMYGRELGYLEIQNDKEWDKATIKLDRLYAKQTKGMNIKNLSDRAKFDMIDGLHETVSDRMGEFLREKLTKNIATLDKKYDALYSLI